MVRKQRLKILKMVEAGDITLDQASRLLEELENAPLQPSFDSIENPPLVLPDQEGASETRQPEVIEADMPENDLPRLNHWKRWWAIPFAISVVVMALGALGMFFGWQAAQFGVGFVLSWFPFVLGILGMVMFWSSRSMRWLHLRIHQKNGKKPETIAISLPIPFGIATWVLRNFNQFMPVEVQGKHLDVMLDEFEKTISPETPFHLWVDEDGEQVEIAIL
jgi:hypothetical protein